MKHSPKNCLILYPLVLLLSLMSCVSNDSLSRTRSNEPQGKEKILFAHDWNGENTINLLVLESGSPPNFTQVAFGSHPAWSINGLYIAFAAKFQNFSQIYAIKMDGTDLKQLTYSDSDNPVWDPNGDYIYYVSNQANVLTEDGIPIPEIYRMETDGSDQVRITNNSDFERAFDLSPDGKKLAVSINVKSNSGIYFSKAIYLIDLRDNNVKQVTEFSANADFPKWSPNGRYIVYTTFSNRVTSICILAIDNFQNTCIKSYGNNNTSTHFIEYMSPSWSVNGKRILFSSNEDDDFDIYSMDINGENQTRLTNLPGDETFPVVAP